MTVSHDGKTIVSSKGKPEGPRLTVIKGESQGKQFLIKKEEVTLGRSAECDILINDSNISREHARIVCLGGIFFVYDNESLNGTFVNGKKLVESQLQSGDIIKIGETEIRFEFSKVLKAQFPKFGAEPFSQKKVEPVVEKGHPRDKWPKFYKISLALIFVLLLGIIFLKMRVKEKTTETNRDRPAVTRKLPPPPIETPDLAGPLDESDSSKFYSQGLLAMMSEDYRQAIFMFQKTLKIDPQHESAKVKLKKCRDILSQTIENLYQAGLREYNIGYYDKAIMEWKKASTLAKGFEKEMYDKANARIAEAKRRQRNLKRQQ